MVGSGPGRVASIEKPQWERFFSASLRAAMTLFDRLAGAEPDHGLAMARDLEESLLPKSRPPGPDPEVAWLSRPASHAGGDFFDVLAGPGDDVYLVIGDVSGTGPSAAMFMTMTSCLLKLLAPDAPGPGTMLEMANRIMRPHLTRRKTLVTAQAVRYRPSAGQITLASAGHMWPYAIDDRGSFAELAAPGLPLGVGAERCYEEAVLSVRPASRLVMYTDGLVECPGPAGEMYGFDRLREQLERRRTEPPASVVRGLIEDVESFASPDRPRDDLSVMAAVWS